ncbi:12919_t:CDS:2 [Ambispora gerdemannii]|uniref:12919_t:CDS:1 n=1 Tax=Ambispora gerdemannii TaxID=144530 RepID=A0A9N9FKP3_9GLOM|nr:12919_t:CDS:2 [Ambispora gerdemannii]
MSITTTILAPTISLTTIQEEANSVDSSNTDNSRIEKNDQKDLVDFLGKDLGIKLYPYLQFEDVTPLKRKDNAKSTVRTGFWTFRSKEVALKELPEIIKKDEEKSQQLYNELRLLKKLTLHENILQYHCITQEPESEKYLLVLQHIDSGDLRSYLEKNAKEMSWVHKLRLTKGIAYALHHLHKSGIIHRRLRSSNILINRGRAILTDPITFTLEYHSSSSPAQSTLPFIDPKLLEDPNLTPDSRSDIYSLGMIMWEISSGRQPFSFALSDQNFVNGIIDGKRESPVLGTPVEYIQLFTKCWNSDPDQRPTIKEVCERLEDMMLTPVLQKHDQKQGHDEYFEDEGIQSDANGSLGIEKRGIHSNDPTFNFDTINDDPMETHHNKHESKFEIVENNDVESESKFEIIENGDVESDSSSNYPESIIEQDDDDEIGVVDNNKSPIPDKLPVSEELDINDSFISETHDPHQQTSSTPTPDIAYVAAPTKRKSKKKFFKKGSLKEFVKKLFRIKPISRKKEKKA